MATLVILIALLVLFAFAGLLSYAPVILSSVKLRKLEQKLEQEIANLDTVFIQGRLVITNKLGEGSIMSSEYGTITFEQALSNQDFAIASVLSLLN